MTMTKDEAIARLKHIAIYDISTRKPVPYLLEIALACNVIGLKVDTWGMNKTDAVAALKEIGAEKMRDTARALLPEPVRPKPPAPSPTPPESRDRHQRPAQTPAGIITAAEANEFLRGLPPAYAEFQKS